MFCIVSDYNIVNPIKNSDISYEYYIIFNALKLMILIIKTRRKFQSGKIDLCSITRYVPRINLSFCLRAHPPVGWSFLIKQRIKSLITVTI